MMKRRDVGVEISVYPAAPWVSLWASQAPSLFSFENESGKMVAEWIDHLILIPK